MSDARMPDDARIARAEELFERAFNGRAEGVTIAPGRVNLIGEHTDYNNGFVLPIAIDRVVTVAYREGDEGVIRAHTTLNNETREVALDATDESRDADWLTYVAGVAWAMKSAGLPVRGADLLIESNLPGGAGLASSAALEVAVCRALFAVTGLKWNAVEAARLARRAENAFVGVACGVMDQMAVACARAGHAMFLDCQSLEMDFVPLPWEATVVVMDTSTRRQLAGTEYNDRRAACERVLARLRVPDPRLGALRDVTLEQLAGVRGELSVADFNRAMHVVTENARVLAAADALRAGDVSAVGALFNASHASLRDLYEVSSPDLDAAVECALVHPACYGARMTGAGFGGCAIALVATDDAADFVNQVKPALRQRVRPAADMFVCRPAAGASLKTL